jgi:4-carboxymuconolactone decarboxylase
LSGEDRVERILAIAAEHPDYEPLIFLCALSALWLKPQSPEAATILQRYLARGYSKDALRETALQLFLMAGFQASLEAMFQIRGILGESLPASVEAPDALLWLERGGELQAEVYREKIGKLRVNLSDASPELAEWTVLVGYGLVLSRPGLPPHWRELLEVVLLVIQGFPRQLHSHLRGALNLGASTDEVELALQASCIFATEPEGRSAWHMWRRIQG